MTWKSPKPVIITARQLTRIDATVRQRTDDGSLQPKFARIDAFEQRFHTLLARVWSSASTGEYSIKGLNLGEEVVLIAFDPTGSFAPVAADRIIVGEDAP